MGRTLADWTPDDPFELLLFGGYGSGKTVLAHTFPRTRTLDADRGILSVKWAIREGLIKKKESEIVYETIAETDFGKHGFVQSAKAIDHMTDTLDKWVQEESEWDTLIVDSATAVNEFVMVRALENMGSLEFSKSWQDSKKISMQVRKIQDYGAAMTLFRQLIEQMRTLRKNIVLICHEHTEESDSGIVRFRYPLLIGNKLRQDIPRMFSEVWWAHPERGKGGKVEYYFQTKSDRTVKAKTRLGFLDEQETFETLNYPRLQERIKEYWGVDK